MHNRAQGFTLIELFILFAIIGILASLAVAGYQTYTVRAQVSDGISQAHGVKMLVAGAYEQTKSPPVDRVEAGMPASPPHVQSSYVTELTIENGRIDITFGNRAHPDIAAESLSLTPYLTKSTTIVWRCGNAPPPAGATELAGGGIRSQHRPASISPRYLPTDCR